MKAFRFELTDRSNLLTVADYRRRARSALPKMVWAFVDGGAEAEATMRDNRDAFARWNLLPTVLTGADGSDLSTEVAGTTISMPVLTAPTGMTGLVRSSGERAVARAAERVGTRAVISSAASYTVEEIAEATEENHFFQLYPWTSQRTGEPLAEKFIVRARQAGYTALFVTVDVPVPGNRLQETRHGMGVPPVITLRRALNVARHPNWVYGFLRHQRTAARMLVNERGPAATVKSARKHQRLTKPDFLWADLEKIRDLWDGPLFVKGILNPDDAERCVTLGADGLVVSNHGGRQLDGAPASLDAMVAILDRLGARVPVLLDSGVRTGSDVVKAVALGATGVLVGRPAVYGLAADGERGVTNVLQILKDEVARCLTLMGVRSVRELNRSHVQPARHVAAHDTVEP